MAKRGRKKRYPVSREELHDLVFRMEHSINSIAWGCDALVHTLLDGESSRIDGVVWVAQKIKEEGAALQARYSKLFSLTSVTNKKQKRL